MILVERMLNAKLPPTALCVAVQVDGQVIPTQNVTNVGKIRLDSIPRS